MCPWSEGALDQDEFYMCVKSRDGKKIPKISQPTNPNQKNSKSKSILNWISRMLEYFITSTCEI